MFWLHVYVHILECCWLGRILFLFIFRRWLTQVWGGRVCNAYVEFNCFTAKSIPRNSHSILYSIQLQRKETHTSKEKLHQHIQNKHLWRNGSLNEKWNTRNILPNINTLCIKRSDWVCTKYFSIQFKIQRTMHTHRQNRRPTDASRKQWEQL